MTALQSIRRFTLCVFTLALYTAGAGAQTAPGANATLEQELGAEIARFVEADRASPPAACQVLFVGSSSIVKWKESLDADLAPVPVINRGFGGSHIEHVNRWFDQIVAPYRPRAIVFYAGENDIDAGKSVDRVVADFDAFMARKTQVLGKTPVYFISLKPSKLRFAEFPAQSKVNDAIRARADTRSDLHYVDVVSPMLQNGKPKDLFGPDDLHMIREGYVIWTRVVRAALLPNTEAEARRCVTEKSHHRRRLQRGQRGKGPQTRTQPQGGDYRPAPSWNDCGAQAGAVKSPGLRSVARHCGPRSRFAAASARRTPFASRSVV